MQDILQQNRAGGEATPTSYQSELTELNFSYLVLLQKMFREDPVKASRKSGIDLSTLGMIADCKASLLFSIASSPLFLFMPNLSQKALQMALNDEEGWRESFAQLGKNPIGSN